MYKQTTRGAMTQLEKEIQMFDFPISDLDAVLKTIDSHRIPSYAMSMLSDVQEMLAAGAQPETIRRTLNRVKYYLSQIR